MLDGLFCIWVYFTNCILNKYPSASVISAGYVEGYSNNSRRFLLKSHSRRIRDVNST
jgi:hypothetical protein